VGSQKIRATTHYLVSGVLFVACCLLLNLALGQTVTPFQRVLLLLCSGVTLAIAALVVWHRFLSEDRDPNYFLYDPARRQNMPPEQLTFTHVNDRLNAYLAKMGESEAQLWSDGYLETRCRFGRGGIFRPLVAYKLLYDLAEQDNDAGWSCFLNANPATVAFLCDALARCGDGEMAKTLQYFKAHYLRDVSALRTYLIGNRAYLKTRMMKFVAAHLDWFY
jgi:hypothetical protein